MEPDGSGCVSMQVSEWKEGLFYRYGYREVRSSTAPADVQWLRSVAVDYSGACGAPALLVVVDRFTGKDAAAVDRTWQMMAQDPNRKIDGQTFWLQRTKRNAPWSSATMAGTIVVPGKAEFGADDPYRSNAVRVRGNSDFFIVMTVQDGEPPAVKVDGEGLAAKVSVGKRVVRFDGTKVVLE
jgi:hypothetical protein